jgi:hypothetical protein
MPVFPVRNWKRNRLFLRKNQLASPPYNAALRELGVSDGKV